MFFNLLLIFYYFISNFKLVFHFFSWIFQQK